MTDHSEVDYNSQAVSQDTLVSIVDDPGKYEVQLNEEGDGPAPKELPQVTYTPDVEIRRKRTRLVSRYYTLMQAWGAIQVAWEDAERLNLTITNGAIGGVHLADNTNVLNTAGIGSGVGIGHVFANQTIRLDGYTGPLYIYSDTDSTPVSVIAVTVEK